MLNTKQRKKPQTNLKKICRKLKIFIPGDMNPKELKMHLFNKVREDQRRDAKEFIETIYAEIEGGIPYQPDTETETGIGTDKDINLSL